MNDLTDEEIVGIGCEVVETERSALAGLIHQINESFAQAVRLILGCQGHVVVTGMGKSGAIGAKIAATFSSTGTPALFLHPSEGVHGDLGAVTKDELVLMLSYSGETDELIAILPALKRLGVPIILITGKPDSSLGRSADVVITAKVEREACPLNLAPTASAVALLAIGDALAVATMKARRFSADDFARLHPGGVLGRRLLLRVQDLMRTGDRLAKIYYFEPTRSAFEAITRARAGACVIVDGSGKLCGLVTDGDLRRALLRDVQLFHRTVSEIMTRQPKTIGPDALATEALHLMQTYQIDDLPVVSDTGEPIGMLDVQDLLKAGLA